MIRTVIFAVVVLTQMNSDAKRWVTVAGAKPYSFHDQHALRGLSSKKTGLEVKEYVG